MGKLLCGGAGRVLAGVLTVVVGVPLILTGVVMLEGVGKGAAGTYPPNLISKEHVNSATRFILPVLLTHLMTCMCAFVLVFDPKCSLALFGLLTCLLVSGLLTFLIHLEKTGLGRLLCAHRCTREVLNVTAIEGLDADPTRLMWQRGHEAFCAYTPKSFSPSPGNFLYSYGGCFVHEPQLIRRFNSARVWWLVGLGVVIASTSVILLFSYVDPPPPYSHYGAHY